jgi:RNA polymerase sigma factor (sigma-70 family)
MRARVLSVLLTATFLGTFVASVLGGTPKTLPDLALGSPLLLHALRAGASAALVTVAAIVVVRLWQGELPSKLSPSGAEWPSDALDAPARQVQEQLLDVERKSMAAVEALADRLHALEQPGQPARSLSAQGPFTDVEAALGKWRDSLGLAVQRDEMADAIASLPDQERLMVALADFEGLSVHDIAGTLGISAAEVARTLQRGRKRVLDTLGRLPGERFDEPPAG